MGLRAPLSTNLGLPDTPLVEDAKLFPEFIKIYNAIKNLAYNLDRYTGALAPVQSDWGEYGISGIRINGLCKIYVPAYEALDVGHLVGFYKDGTVFKARKSQDGVRKCRGFASSQAAVGETVEVTLVGLYPTFSSPTLITNDTYYQSGTAGVLGASGFGTQAVGFALSETQLFFNPNLD